MKKVYQLFLKCQLPLLSFPKLRRNKAEEIIGIALMDKFSYILKINTET